ncbi:jg6253 [Pararge aegeria aegeria]|uniref:Jg6253 protein n=1 Tax=Pararge aegeria aegeria TaxID=348720 RepID=A0A8S4SG22_9NEOP|nr:jg6253 [Pararge aegeria aegeria]
MDLHRPVEGNKSYDAMTSDEKLRYDHQKLHEMHRGHESMHMKMVLILIGTLVVAQVIVVEWKKFHYRSYAFFTMVAMWSIPLLISTFNHSYRFIIVWTIFTLLTTLVIWKSSQKPMSNTTPRIKKIQKPRTRILLRHQKVLHFTIVVFLEQAYYTKEGMPTRYLENNVCAVCGNKLLVEVSEEGVIENTYKLPCGHVFHEFCIRGWCIVGKRQTCPYCKEKVDLKQMFTNPWDRPHLLYGQLLDWVRWLVAWQPLVLFLAQGINWFFGLE